MKKKVNGLKAIRLILIGVGLISLINEITKGRIFIGTVAFLLYIFLVVSIKSFKIDVEVKKK